MKALVNFTRKLITLVGVLAIIFGVYLFMSGNISIRERAVDHNKEVYVDGVLQSSEDWTDILGYELGIDLYDGTYVGL